MGIVAEDIASEDLMKEGVKVLISRLGYANTARFIAILDGETMEDYPNDKPFPSCLIFGRTERGRNKWIDYRYRRRV